MRAVSALAQKNEFMAAVRTAAEGSPYVVTPTKRGFDVTLDIVDAKYFDLYHPNGLKRVFTHHVSVDDDGTYAITDDSRTLEWKAGIPDLSARVERMRGKQWERSTEKIWALGTDLRFGKVVDYTFNSEEGRGLITGVAKQLGLKKKRGTEERIGLAVALLGAAGAVLTLVVLGLMALLD